VTPLGCWEGGGPGHWRACRQVTSPSIDLQVQWIGLDQRGEGLGVAAGE
jgi:hypothetical protein